MGRWEPTQVACLRPACACHPAAHPPHSHTRARASRGSVYDDYCDAGYNQWGPQSGTDMWGTL